MSAADRLLALKQAAANKVAAIAAEQTDAQGTVDQLAGLDSDMQSESAATAKENYDKGFNDGVAQSGTVGTEGKIFSNDELDAEVKAATEPLDAQIVQLNADKASLSAQITGLQAQVDELQGHMGNTQSLVDAAVAATKLEIAAKIEAVEIDNNDLVAKLKSEGAPVVSAPVDQPATGSETPVETPVEGAPASFKKK